MSLLPAPIDTGPVTANWRFQPSTELGGDAFGYYWLDGNTLAIYLLDVSGHGVGAAMHSVTALNLLRQRALPQVDFTDPAAVLASLNNRLQMDDHDGMFFTMWYGVYRVTTRTLRYSAAGHHPAYLVTPDRERFDALGTPNLMIGAMPGLTYDVHETAVAPGSTLHLFSDGVFEIMTPDGRQLGLQDFLPHLVAPPQPGLAEPERLYRLVVGTAKPGPLDDDFSLLTTTFL
jgi:sigma-B regulation protein RsbU (phosphoserine phosphatase)